MSPRSRTLDLAEPPLPQHAHHLLLPRYRVPLNARIELVEHRLLTRLGALAVVLLGLLFAALHLCRGTGERGTMSYRRIHTVFRQVLITS